MQMFHSNPFYPAIGGTHKNYSNTDNGITGTQPASLTANDVCGGELYGDTDRSDCTKRKQSLYYSK